MNKLRVVIITIAVASFSSMAAADPAVVSQETQEQPLEAKKSTAESQALLAALNPVPEVRAETAASAYSAPAIQNPPLSSGSGLKCLSSIEFLTGFAWGKLRVAKRNYNAIPFMVDLNLDLKPLLKKINLDPAPLVQFTIEPFASFITSPESNAEIGNTFLFKVGALPETSKFQPYFLAGAGMLYITLHTHEQGTQFNFIEYGGLGAHYYFTKDTAITLEGRFRHLSNAGIGSPNTGINSCFIVSGITKKF